MGQAGSAQSVTHPIDLLPGTALIPSSIMKAATPAASAATLALDAEELAFLTLINTYRAQNGAGPLQVSIALENSSRWMSNDMATHNTTAHTDSSGRDPQSRMSAFGYPYYPWGENIAGGFASAQSVFNSWMTYCDPDGAGNCTYAHRQNMLNPSFVVMGIGRSYVASSTYGWYWTTDFGGYLDPTLGITGSTGPDVTTSSLGSGQVGAPYSQTLAASGGTMPYSWSLLSGTLPGGLTLNPATGQISGTPLVAVTNTPLQFGVTDSSSPAKSATANLTLTVSGAASGPAIVLPASMAMNPGDQAAFPVTLSAPAPAGGIFISLTSGNPSVAALNTDNVFIGEGQTASTRSKLTAGVAGSAIITASASGMAPANTQVQVGGGVVPVTTMSLSPASLTINGTITQNLSLTLSAAAPNGGLSVTLSSSNTGVASVPASMFVPANTSSVGVPVSGVAPGSATIAASAANYGTASAGVTVVVAASLAIVGNPLANGQIGAPYSQTLAATGGTPPYSWTLAAGALPAGLALVQGTGQVSGTPTAATNAPLTFQVTDSSSPAKTASANFTLTITPAASAASIAATGGTPQSTSTGSIFASTLMATVRDASGNPLSGATVIFNAPPASGASGSFAGGLNTAVTNGSGLAISAAFTANSIGGSYVVTASVAGAAASASFSLTNVSGPAGGMTIVLPSNITMNPGDQVALPVTLSAPAPSGGVFIFLTISNSAVATLNTANAFIGEGQTTSTRSKLTASTAGSATITASASGFAPASATVQVGGGAATAMSLSPASITIGASATQNLTLILSTPAPAGGVTVTLSSSSTGVATVTPGVTIAANTSSANLTVTGGAAGSATITASAAGMSSVTAGVTVTASPITAISLPANTTVTAGASAALGVTLSAPAPSGGMTIALASSDPSKVTVTGSVFIAGGNTTPATRPQIGGVAAGSATITASVSGYTPGTGQVQVVAAGGSSSFSPPTLTINSGSAGNLTLILSAPAPSGGMIATLSSSNSGIASIPAVVNFAAGAASAIVTVTGVASGSAAITANSPNFGTASASVSVSSSSSGIILPANLTVMPGQSAPFPVLLATAAPAGGVFISLSSDSPNVTVAPANIFIPQGGMSANRAPTVNGVNIGLANITAAAASFPPATTQVQVGSVSSAAMSFSPANLTLNGGATQNLSLTLSAPPASAMTVSLTSGNPGVATVPATVSFGANVTAASVAVTGLSPGSATITASAAGLPSATASVTVAQSSGVGVPANTTVTPGQSITLPVTLPTAAPPNGVTVFLSSSDTTKVTVTPGVFIAGGAVSPNTQPQVSGINSGSAVIVATAAGYNPGSGQVQVTSSGGGTSYFLPATLNLNGAVTQNIQLNLSGLAPAGLIVTLSSSNTAVAVLPTSVNFPTGSTTMNIAVSGIAAGSAIVTANIPNFGTATANVIVTTLQGVTVTWYGACWQPATLYGITGNFQAIDYAISAPSAVTLQGSLFFSANCDPNGGVDNMNDFGSLTNPGHAIQGFSHHPDVIPSSAVYWIGPRTADGMCAPGSPCSGCVNYNAKTPLCSALP